MEAALFAIGTGLVVALIAFIAKLALLPLLCRLVSRARRSRRCATICAAAQAEIAINIERLVESPLASIEQKQAGSPRTLYRFDQAAMQGTVPTFPTLRRSAFDDLRDHAHKCVPGLTALLDDVLAAFDEFGNIDRAAVRDAWHDVAHPGMERMVMDDPGHAKRGKSATALIETNRVMARLQRALAALDSAPSPERSAGAATQRDRLRDWVARRSRPSTLRG